MKKIGKKIVVVGVSASGKTAFARKLAEKTGLPLVLMDSLMWNPGWEYIGDEATVRKLEEVSRGSEWIVEGYITKGARTFLFDRADTIIYLDYPRIVATWRYLKRWWRHRTEPRPEMPGSPEKFDFKFLRLVWSKGEALSLNRFLKGIKDPEKIMRIETVRETKGFLESI